MKFDTPATQNPIDQLKVIGQPLDRIDGPLKVSGTATYAYEYHDIAPNAAYGFLVASSIAKGRITAIDLTAARSAPGVLAIVTAENAGAVENGFFSRVVPLAGPEIQHYHQAVALVVAERFEQARAAAALVQVDYAPAEGSFILADAMESAVAVDRAPDAMTGDFETAFETAPVRVDAVYTTPDHSHAMMEPHATIAAWDGDTLNLWSAVQLLSWGTRDMAKILGIPPENIHLRSPYIGGGFGGKGSVASDAVLAALGARAVGRPVKVALPRDLMFNNTTHRSATIQRVRIGATRDGIITAIGHDGWAGNLPGGWPENPVAQTRTLYAGANRRMTFRLGALDLPEASAMRAPCEAPGMMGLEIAMDEMAEKLGMDPVEFRVRNDTQVEPENPARNFSIRQLVECMRIGAEQFGWNQRNPLPAQTRDGRWLIGMGMAAAIRGNPLMKSAARVRLESDGMLTVETDMTDIGTGSYTIIAQTAAEMMGVGIERVAVRLGDSRFPVSVGSGGQWGANCSTSGVYAACVKLREAIAQKLGFNAADVTFADGMVGSGNRQIALAEAATDGPMVGEDAIEFEGLQAQYSQQTFGAHFTEVAVDAATGEVRMRRMLSVCAAGRILNPKTARSQIIGGMTMGIGAALMEEMVVDRRGGFFVNHDLASYEVPVHADIPHLDVIFLDEVDPISSPMKAKGVGELGISGVAAAVANAVHNATGIRVRDYPITLDKFLDQLPAMH